MLSYVPCLEFWLCLNMLSSPFSFPNVMCLLGPTVQELFREDIFAYWSASQNLAYGALKNTHRLGPTPRESVLSKDSQVITL